MGRPIAKPEEETLPSLSPAKTFFPEPKWHPARLVISRTRREDEIHEEMWFHVVKVEWGIMS